MRTVLFEKQAFEDVQHWSSSEPKLLRKIIDLISDIQSTLIRVSVNLSL